MSTLTNIEKLKIEKILESPSGAGYVLDFSNRTFQDFILNATNKDIYLEKYAVSGASKANRLRAFWDIESDSIVGKLISELLDYWKTRKLLQKEVINQHEQALFDACKEVTHRLLGVSSSKEMTEDEFIQKTFKDVSINKINLDSGIIDVLDQRLSEINKCLKANAPLAVIFLCGSTLEGILLGVASNKSKDFNTANSSPKDKSSGKVLPFQRWTTSINELILWLTNTFLNCTFYTIKDLKHHYTDAHSGKQVFIDSLAKEYPELLQAYHKEKRNRNVYYDKVFEAIACARIEAGQ